VEKVDKRLIVDLNKVLRGLLGSLILLAAFLPFDVKAKSLALISDEETETYLANVVKPLFRAAGIKFYRDNLYIVNDNSLNAFVSDGNRLFVHTGTIIKAQSLDELSGVLAHETGHIMGGHIIRQKLRSKDLSYMTLASAILAGASAAAGQGDAAMAVLLGGQASALNQFVRYRTEEERSADEAAVMLLNKTGQSVEGMLNFMKKIKNENILSGQEEIPYFRTHPITAERIAFFENNVNKKTTAKNEEDFERIKAKLKAFLQDTKQTLSEYPTEDKSIAAQYAHAIVYMKKLEFKKALQKINSLIMTEPDNPFFYELRGQILSEIGDISAAKKDFAKAYHILPQSHLMQINYAQAILENNPDIADAQKAVNLLNRAIKKVPSSYGWMLLSRGYGVIGDMAAANYAAAEYSMMIGNIDIAQKQIEIADKLPSSAEIELKIDDLRLRIKKLKKQ